MKEGERKGEREKGEKRTRGGEDRHRERETDERNVLYKCVSV